MNSKEKRENPVIKTDEPNGVFNNANLIKKRKQLLTLLNNDKQKQNFLKYDINVQRLWLEKVYKAKTNERKNLYLQQLRDDLDNKQITLKEIKEIKPKSTTIEKTSKHTHFSGSYIDLYGETLNNVRGSMKAIKKMNQEDTNYNDTLRLAIIEKQTREKLLNEVEGWIIKLVNRTSLYYKNIQKEDLISAVKTKVWDALENYNYKTSKLTTYLTPIIKKALHNEIRKTAFEVKISDHDFEKIKRIKKFQREFRSIYGKYPEYQEISNHLSISYDDVIILSWFTLDHPKPKRII